MADVDELRLRRYRSRERVEVVALIAQGHGHRRRALLARVDHVARERGPAAHDLVARIERRLAQHVEAPVRAGPDGDLPERHAVSCRQCLVEAVDPAVRVAVELERGALHRLERGREGRERPLVGGELDDPLQAELALDVLDRFARLVGRQLLDGGPEEVRTRLGHGRTLPTAGRSRHVRRQPP